MKEAFKKASEKLIEATTNKEMTEMEYALKEAEIMFSAEMNGASNQTQRDARLKKLMEKEYRELVNARTDYRIAYYKWQTLKVLLESK